MAPWQPLLGPAIAMCLGMFVILMDTGRVLHARFPLHRAGGRNGPVHVTRYPACSSVSVLRWRFPIRRPSGIGVLGGGLVYLTIAQLLLARDWLFRRPTPPDLIDDPGGRQSSTYWRKFTDLTVWSPCTVDKQTDALGVDDRSICEATLFDLPVTWREPRRFLVVGQQAARLREGLDRLFEVAGAEELPVRLRYLYPILEDLGDEAGVASGHYFHQDLWAARKYLPAVRGARRRWLQN